MCNEDKIREAAYFVWLNNGCPEGADVECWLEAEARADGECCCDVDDCDCCDDDCQDDECDCCDDDDCDCCDGCIVTCPHCGVCLELEEDDDPEHLVCPNCEKEFCLDTEDAE